MMAVWARDADGRARGARSYYGDDVDADDQSTDWRSAVASGSGGASSYYNPDNSHQ